MWHERNGNLTVEEEWLVLGCRDSYQSCCCPPCLGSGAEKGKSKWETTLGFKGSQQTRSEGRTGCWCTPLSPFDGFFMFNLWWHPAGHQHHSSSSQWHVHSWISGQTIVIWGGGAARVGVRPPTPILSSISWRAFSNCWGVPRIEKMRTLGSVLGGGILCSSTWARDCSLMFLMVSPPGGMMYLNVFLCNQLLTSTSNWCPRLGKWTPLMIAFKRRVITIGESVLTERA